MAGNWQTQQAEIEYQRKLAERLSGDTEMPQGGMIGNTYVPPAWTQMLAKALNPMWAKQHRDEAGRKAESLAGEQMAERTGTLDRFSRALEGTPEQQLPPDVFGPAAPAVPGDRNAAMAELGKSRDPMLQQLYMAQMLKGMEPDKYGNTPHYDQTGRAYVTNDKGGVKYLDGVTARDKVEMAPSGVAYNPFQTKPGTVFNDPNKLMNIGEDGAATVNQPLVGIKKDIAKSGASRVSVSTKQETEEAKTVGKGFGEEYVSIQKADRDANTKIANYDQLGTLLDGVKTGKLTPLGTEISALAKSIGIDIDPKLGNKQAAEALSNQVALQLRNPAGGAGMPGALSDKDREFLVKMTPGLGKDPEANRILVSTAKALAKRDKEVAQLARTYRQKRGTLDEGFYNELAQFSAQNPLFSAKPAAPDAAPAFDADKEARYQAWKKAQLK